MTCRKSLDLDLADFVLHPGAEAWAAFRAHYPSCRDCAAEVAVWEEMQALLRSGGPGGTTAHPPKELLLRYEEQRTTLSANEASVVQKHLATCRACPDELAALRTFDFSGLRPPSSLPARSWWSHVAEVAARMRPVVLHPIFAYSLVLVLLYSVLVQPRVVSRPGPAEQIARESSVEPADDRRESAVDGRHHEVSALPPAAERMIGVAPEAAAPARPHGVAVDAPAAPVVAPAAHEGESRLASARSRPPRLASRRPQPAPSTVPDHGAAEHSATSVPPVPGGDENASDEGSKDTGSETLAHEEPADVDSDEPTVLGLAETEVPHDQARATRSTAVVAGVARADGAWATIVLAPGQTPAVQLATLASGILLRVPRTDPDAEIRVVGPNGREPARETVRSPSGEPVAVRIRASELMAGTYHVLTYTNGSAAPEAPRELRFLAH